MAHGCTILAAVRCVTTDGSLALPVLTFNAAVANEELQMPPLRQKHKPRQECSAQLFQQELTTSLPDLSPGTRLAESQCHQAAADVAAAAGAIAAAAALQVIQAAGKQVQAQLQVHVAPISLCGGYCMCLHIDIQFQC